MSSEAVWLWSGLVGCPVKQSGWLAVCPSSEAVWLAVQWSSLAVQWSSLVVQWSRLSVCLSVCLSSEAVWLAVQSSLAVCPLSPCAARCPPKSLYLQRTPVVNPSSFLGLMSYTRECVAHTFHLRQRLSPCATTPPPLPPPPRCVPIIDTDGTPVLVSFSVSQFGLAAGKALDWVAEGPRFESASALLSLPANIVVCGHCHVTMKAGFSPIGERDENKNMKSGALKKKNPLTFFERFFVCLLLLFCCCCLLDLQSSCVNDDYWALAAGNTVRQEPQLADDDVGLNVFGCRADVLRDNDSWPQ